MEGGESRCFPSPQPSGSGSGPGQHGKVGDKEEQNKKRGKKKKTKEEATMPPPPGVWLPGGLGSGYQKQKQKLEPPGGLAGGQLGFSTQGRGCRAGARRAQAGGHLLLPLPTICLWPCLFHWEQVHCPSGGVRRGTDILRRAPDQAGWLFLGLCAVPSAQGHHLALPLPPVAPWGSFPAVGVGSSARCPELRIFPSFASSEGTSERH